MNGFVKVAAAVPEIRVADVEFNKESVLKLIEDAEKQGAEALCLPELCLTGATCGDLFLQETLIRGAMRALEDILARTRDFDVLFALGLPARIGGRLYSCAAACQKGKLLGLLPKESLSVSERRWFSSGKRLAAPNIFTVSGLPVNVFVGGDFDKVTVSGAAIILNSTANPEIIGIAPVRREKLERLSANLGATVVCAGAGAGESTTDFVYAGHGIIASCGKLCAEMRFETGMLVSDLERSSLRSAIAFQDAPVPCAEPGRLPFVPQSAEDCGDALKIAARGLSSRMRHIGAERLVIGVSGGLDSTLALLICAKAMDELKFAREKIIAITMPGFGTTGRTKNNAVALTKLLGATLRTIPIEAAVRQHFADIGYNEKSRTAVFENAQARERTQILMDVANDCGGLVVGTGDMSELALGWATYNGDHMSMYGVNAGIPKTLVRALVSHVADTDTALSAVLRDVLDTPVSPELLPSDEGTQSTEDILGPFEAHDFFLYHFSRQVPPREILRLAEGVFEGVYDREQLLKWLKTFIRRFFAQQFKRSCMPDGSQVTSVSLSPRGGLCMPSDAASALWLRELE